MNLDYYSNSSNKSLIFNNRGKIFILIQLEKLHFFATVLYYIIFEKVESEHPKRKQQKFRREK